MGFIKKLSNEFNFFRTNQSKKYRGMAKDGLKALFSKNLDSPGHFEWCHVNRRHPRAELSIGEGVGFMRH